MKHGYQRGDYRLTYLQPSPAFFTRKGTVKVGEAATYRFDGYKASIIEFLVAEGNVDREIKFLKNTSVDEYGTEFSDSNLFVLIGNLTSGPTTPGGAINEAIRQAAGGFAIGAITGTIAALGAAGRTAVQVYELASGLNDVLKQHIDIGEKVTDLAARKMYKNRATRQLHHKFHSRISVALRGRADNASLRRAHKVIDTGGTAITCGALAVLVSERA